MCYSQQKSKPYLVKDPDCDQPKISAEEVETMVKNAIFEFADNYALDKEDKIIEPEDTISLLLSQKEILEKKIKRLYNIYAESENSILLDTINDLQKQLEKINNQIDFEEQNSNILQLREEKNIILSTVKDIWDILSVQEQKTIIRKLIDKIIITDAHITINFSI